MSLFRVFIWWPGQVLSAGDGEDIRLSRYEAQLVEHADEWTRV
jgi:hypothetical protein